jgi:hypothetical protein
MFNRQWKVTVGTKLVEHLRVHFVAHKAMDADPNTLDLHISNLSQASRDAISSQGPHPLVTVHAGYDGSIGQVFAGDARAGGVFHAHKAPDWDTHVQCGENELGYTTSTTNRSYAGGAEVVDMVRDLSRDASLEATQAIQRLGQGDLAGGVMGFMQGTTLTGNTYGQLDKVLKAAQVEWTVQDGVLFVYKGKETAPGTGVLLSPATGLISAPSTAAKVDKNLGVHLVKVRSLLNAALRPLGRVRVESASLTGNFRIVRVTHTGDSHGPEWYSDLELEPI